MKHSKLEVRNLYWGVQERQNILKNISFKLELGEILGVLGPNGSGKSTLLRLIYRYIKPKKGNILVDGQDIWQIAPKWVAQKIAVVLQENAAEFPLTVKEVVLLGRIPYRSKHSRPGHDFSLVAKVMESLNLSHLANRKLNTLSGGERQMVMAARAIVQEPSIFILDEPTNHLDIRNKLEILSLIKSLGITTVCTLHDLNSAANLVDKVLILDRGEMVGYGSYEETLTQDIISKTYTVKSYKNFLEPDQSIHFSFQI